MQVRLVQLGGTVVFIKDWFGYGEYQLLPQLLNDGSPVVGRIVQPDAAVANSVWVGNELFAKVGFPEFREISESPIPDPFPPDPFRNSETMTTLEVPSVISEIFVDANL